MRAGYYKLYGIFIIMNFQYNSRRRTIVTKSVRNLYVFDSDAFGCWVKTMAAVPGST